jgi:hypothetical protein
MPFLTGPRFIENPDQLQLYRPFCRLHPPPPVRPSVPVRADVGATEPQGLAVPSRPADGDLSVPIGTDKLDVGTIVPEAKRVGGVEMHLDISVWRLPHLWRLALSFVARRLGR